MHNLQSRFKVNGKSSARVNKKRVIPCFCAIYLNRLRGIPYSLTHEVKISRYKPDKTGSKVVSKGIGICSASFFISRDIKKLAEQMPIPLDTTLEPVLSGLYREILTSCVRLYGIP